MRVQQIKWGLAFVAALPVGAASVVIVLSVINSREDQATAQESSRTRPATAAHAVTTPGPLATASITTQVTVAAEPFAVIVPRLPEGFTPAPKRPCPEEWRRISDGAANYSFCLPPGWAILDPSSSESSDRTILHFESAAVLSPEGFPYPYAGSYEKGPRHLVRDSEKDVIWMQLFFIPLGADQPMSCEAKPAETLAGLPSAGCENSFDIPSGTDQAVPDPEGRWYRLFVVVPLPDPNAPRGEAVSSFALGILFEGRNDAVTRYRDLIRQILDTFEAQP